MSKFANMSDDYLKRNYVPAVYQPDIYGIDYQKLKDAGVRLISFDIDDTIAGLEEKNPSKEAKTLFENLKNMGFSVILLSNTYEDRVAHFASKLGIEGEYVARAEKPLTAQFVKLLDRFGLDKSQMAHVGNSQRNDIAGGNAAGIITCLVRRAGVIGGLAKRIPGYRTEGQKLREELENRGIWRKHSLYEKGDQYYQLGEAAGYQKMQISKISEI